MIKKIKLLITGGAGFIGSNLVKKYIKDSRVSLVRVIDNLSNGYYKNIKEFINHPNFEFIEADICDYNACLKATKGISKVSHQAALGSVPRSIKDPMITTKVNILGTVNILHSCYVNSVENVVLACSSSTYGDSTELPKIEHKIGNFLSPYAVSKYSIELFADVFYKNYNLNFIGLRYFNVFGKNQNPNNPYAAVIPIFCKNFIDNKKCDVFGDGNTSRDFTYVDNVVHANDLALFNNKKSAFNQIYNVACGNQISLNEVIDNLKSISGKNVHVNYQDEREGDVKHSKADISKISLKLGYKPKILFKEGLKRNYENLKNIDF